MNQERISLSRTQYHRSGLKHTLAAIARGELRVGFLGGSITAPYGDTWPEGVISWFSAHFPKVRLFVENVAIGATGSMSGVFRAQRDLIERNCDLVFVEYAVNDRLVAADQRRKTQEGIVRKLLAGTGRDVIFTYTYAQDMYEDMSSGRVPASVQDLDEIAAYYGIGSVWMGLHALDEVRRGILRWEEWLPDGLHPKERGSWSYANVVSSFLHNELIEAPKTTVVPFRDLIALEPQNWEDARTLPLSEVRLEGPWRIRRSQHWWADQILETAAVGARLSFNFEGRALCLGMDFGKTSAEYRCRVDGGEWKASSRERLNWCPNSGWFRFDEVPHRFTDGAHTFELEVVHGNRADCTGTNLGLAQIGVV